MRNAIRTGTAGQAGSSIAGLIRLTIAAVVCGVRWNGRTEIYGLEPLLLGGCGMGRKRDIRQIEAIAKEFDMDDEERREFGDYVEDCKRRGELGSGQNGDFTYGELRAKVPEFRREE